MYGEPQPEDTEAFGGGGEEMEWDDDKFDIWWLVYYKARAEAIVVHEDKETARERAQEAGFHTSEITTKPVIVNPEEGFVEFPNLP